jgi:hypothetical protein
MAYQEDFSIDQGSDLAIEIHIDSADGSTKNLSNYSVAAKLKLNYNSDSTDTHAFGATVSDALNGIITLELTNTQTNALKPRKRYMYDVEVSFQDDSSNTITERVLEGNIYVSPSITR